jgi:hypothetical protein
MSTPRKRRIGKEACSSRLSRARGSCNPAGHAQRGARAGILTASQQVAQVVNAGLTILYWQIGTRIRKDILKEQRAAYGKEIITETDNWRLSLAVASGSETYFAWCASQVFPDLEVCHH